MNFFIAKHKNLQIEIEFKCPEIGEFWWKETGLTNLRQNFCFDVIDVVRKKIVAFVYLDKYKKYKFKKYKGASSKMEFCAFQRIMPKLGQANKIRSIVKDGDAYNVFLLKNSNLKVWTIHDSGQAIKNFKTSFKNYNKKYGLIFQK